MKKRKLKRKDKKRKTRNLNQIINKRLNFIFAFTIFFFVLLVLRFVQIMVLKKDYYTEQLNQINHKEIEGESTPRGRIYDRNYRLLVDNKSIPVISYVKDKKITTEEEIDLAYKVADVIVVSFSSLRENQLKEFYMLLHSKEVDKRITEEEWEKYQNRILSSEDIYILKRSRITEEDLKTLNDLDKEAALIYMRMNEGYSYDPKEIKKDQVTKQEMTYIAEHQDLLKGFEIRYDWERVYPYGDTFRTILGTVSKITRETKDYYLAQGYALNDFVGNSFLEKQYEEYLKGEKSIYTIIDNQKILKEEGTSGNDIVLTIDIRLQQAVEKILEKGIKDAKYDPSTELFHNAYVVIQDPTTGEILAMAGREVIKKKNQYEVHDASSGVLTHPMTVGSVVKGASLYVGFTNHAVEIGEYQKDECIKLYSKPQKCSWKTLGTINDLSAIANSSNVYQFKIAMRIAGQPYRYNMKFEPKASVFDLYRGTFQQFGLGVKTGIDLPVESVGNIGSDTSGDLLLNFAIGQYDTYTTMQLSQYITTIATGGKRMQPHLLKEVRAPSSTKELGEVIFQSKPVVLNTLTETKYLSRIQKAFHEVMTTGLGKGFMGYGRENVAGKTGTSESFMDTDNDGKIDTPTLSNAFIGYAPYKNPKMTIAITFPNIVNGNSDSDLRSYKNIRMTREISEKYFELYPLK